MYKLLVGIEHLMTGVMLKSDAQLTFEPESPSIFKVTSSAPIICYWPVTGGSIQSEEVDSNPDEKYSSGEAEYYAKVVGPAMVDLANKSRHDMQVYTRRGNEYYTNGQDSKYAPGEPSMFPPAVIKAMRRKHGADSDRYLSQLRWARDHWFYHIGNMYVGVEPDGYIHT